MESEKRIPNERLRRARELQGWSQEKLAEKIGTSSVSISRWETGATSPEPYFREKLCQLFKKNAVELGFLPEDGENAGLSAHLQAVESQKKGFTPSSKGSPDEAQRDQGGSDSVKELSGLWPSTIPNEYYYRLPGRERALEQVLMALGDPQGAAAVVIDGLGGLGKTALAAELARRAVHVGMFEGVIGESAKLEEFSSGHIVTIRNAVLDFDQLLNAFAQQLGYWDLPTLKTGEKQAALARLLRLHPYLLFVDNLETAENATTLVAQLRPFLGVSRAIVTSRTQAYHDFARSLSLRGLDLEDALVFLEMDRKQRGVQQALELPREKLVEIHKVTGGAPLAMKLVLAQASFLNVDVVLNHIQHSRGDTLYTFIFRRSWEQLSSAARKILYYIGRTAVSAVDWEELSHVGIAENEEQLIGGIEQLVDYSLLEISSLAGEKWYAVHQLTRQFVNGELPSMWKEQGLQ